MAGDEVLGVWTSPVEDSDVGLRACTAALGMLEAIDDYNRDHAQLPILTRFGLDAGWIEQGNFGAGADYSFNVIGDAVNTAKRIEGLNKTLGTGILASAKAASRIDTLMFRSVGRFLLKGKSHPIEVKELVGRTGSLSDSTVERCRLFEQALEAIHHGNIQLAFTVLNSIRRENADDGPTSFYLGLIESASHDRRIRSDGVVVLDE
ncbi:MAG: adenylate/guanylate cyclase domain-containing protein [Gammaproteobacteria bacterium]|nr:adenylate/guanylate cyclase domain-containing protein [Gammaproteobacteria bacterium]